MKLGRGDTSGRGYVLTLISSVDLAIDVSEYEMARTLVPVLEAAAARWGGPALETVIQSLRGRLAMKTGDPAAAREHFEQALALRRAASEHDPEIAGDLLSLGTSLAYSDPERAQRVTEEALEMRERTMGPDHPVVALALHNLGFLLARNGQRERARALFERAIAIRTSTFGEDHVLNAESLGNLGKIAIEEGKLDEASVLLDRAIAIVETAYGADSPELTDLLTAKGAAFVNGGRLREAIPILERAVASLERLGAEPGALALPLYTLSAAVWASGDRKRAIELAERSRAGYVARQDAEWILHLDTMLRELRGK
jgi:tetratricopeptide (TPR) repeat protein